MSELKLAQWGGDTMTEDEGGDAACWLVQVCPECGALLEDRSAPCWRCGARPESAAAG